jgi:peptidoglycan/LPS O-acetylase OafA/YrhL
VIGTWLGIQWSEWGEIWKKYSRHFACAVILGLFGYLCLDLAAIRNPNINSYAYNMSLTLFTTTIALWLIGAVQRLEKRPIGRVLQRVGNWSLPLFLTHPMALYFLSGPRLSKIWERVPLQFALIGVLMFLVSWCVSVIIMRLKLDRLLLGRSLASQDGN